MVVNFEKSISVPEELNEKHIESANEDNTKRIRFDDGRGRGTELKL